MNTTLSRTTTRPPDTQDRQVLALPAPDELRALSTADRLSLRLGLWLLLRAERAAQRAAALAAPTDPEAWREQRLDHRDSFSVLTFDLQGQLR